VGDQELRDLRRLTDEAIADRQVIDARALIEQLWRAHPGPATAAFVNSRLAKLPPAPGRRSATLAILRSFTVEPIVPIVRAAAALNGLDLTVHVGDFNSYTQEVLDPRSAVYESWHPDVVVIAVQTRDIAPELWTTFADLSPDDVAAVVERVVSEYATMFGAFRRSSSCSLVIHGLELPARPALGVADHARPSGQTAAIDEINEQLRRLAGETTGVYVLDYDGLVARAGRRAWYDHDKWLSMRMPIRAEHLYDVAMEWLRHIQPLAGRIAKALIVDLDNTLWGGVLGEDLIEGVLLSPEHDGAGYWALQRAIRDLMARGILLGICSKNNEDDVREMFENHPAMVLRWSDFAAIRTNWDSKADNLRSIANELNIGLDALAFLDDNPAECALIRQELPDVIVLELDRVPDGIDNPVSGNPFFERLSLTNEDLARGDLYVAQRERTRAAEEAGSLDDYLHSLKMTVTVRDMAPEEIPRVAQLTQKTNQFNLTTRRYTEPEIEAFAARCSARVYVASASDRFGDHGLIGVIIAETGQASWEIDTMLLSCRVIGRGVETAMLSRVVSDSAASGAAAVDGAYIPTAKNAPARHFFETHGFSPTEVGDHGSRWRYDVYAGSIEVPAWIDARS
jgi:FkbH-like protein